MLLGDLGEFAVYVRDGTPGDEAQILQVSFLVFGDQVELLAEQPGKNHRLSLGKFFHQLPVMAIFQIAQFVYDSIYNVFRYKFHRVAG